MRGDAIRARARGGGAAADSRYCSACPRRKRLRDRRRPGRAIAALTARCAQHVLALPANGAAGSGNRDVFEECDARGDARRPRATAGALRVLGSQRASEHVVELVGVCRRSSRPSSRRSVKRRRATQCSGERCAVGIAATRCAVGSHAAIGSERGKTPALAATRRWRSRRRWASTPWSPASVRQARRLSPLSPATCCCSASAPSSGRTQAASRCRRGREWRRGHVDARGRVLCSFVTIRVAVRAFLQERTLKRKRPTALTGTYRRSPTAKMCSSRCPRYGRRSLDSGARRWSRCGTGSRSNSAGQPQDRADPRRICCHRCPADRPTVGRRARTASGATGVAGLSSAHSRISGRERDRGINRVRTRRDRHAYCAGKGLICNRAAYLMGSQGWVVTLPGPRVGISRVTKSPYWVFR